MTPQPDTQSSVLSPQSLQAPPALRPGGHIAVLAASGPSELQRGELGISRTRARGYRVTLASNIAHRSKPYLAGSDDERVEELNRYLRSDDVDAFFFARGGY